MLDMSPAVSYFIESAIMYRARSVAALVTDGQELSLCRSDRDPGTKDGKSQHGIQSG